jgi:transposase
MQLARLLRAGELTEVWVPDERHEAVRELIRPRGAAVDDLRRKRQATSSLMLRYGRSYPGKKTRECGIGNGCRRNGLAIPRIKLCCRR